MEVTRHTVTSDKMGFHFFELPKLPEEVNDKDELQLWLSLFKAETEKELEQIKALNVPEIEQAIHAYYEIIASPEFRERERMREEARHNEASALRHAKINACAENLQNLMDNRGWSIEQAMSVLNIPEEERAKYREYLQKQ